MGFDPLIKEYRMKNAIEQDKYRTIIFDYKDFGSIVSDIYTSRLEAERDADAWIAGDPRGSTIEVVRVL